MTPGPERDVTRDDIRETLRERDDPRRPLTTNELADEHDTSRQTAYDRLRELHELEEVGTRKVGANTRIWWLTAAGEA